MLLRHRQGRQNGEVVNVGITLFKNTSLVATILLHSDGLDGGGDACAATMIPEVLPAGALLLVDSIMPDRFCGESPD